MSDGPSTLPAVSRMGGKAVLFVMAAEPEYGPHLKARFAPLMTGVGPVEAAVEMTAALSTSIRAGSPPDLVVSLGSAGSRVLEQAEIHQAVSVSYRDMDASALGFEKGATPFLDLPAIVPLPFRIPGIREATLSTGANVVSGPAVIEQLDSTTVVWPKQQARVDARRNLMLNWM